MVETDAHRLLYKNVEAIRLGIELSKPKANKEATAKAKADSHAKEQARLFHRLMGMRRSSGMVHHSTSTFNDDAPSHGDTYTEEGHNRVDDRKGMEPTGKW
ncbi:hypothetical protein D1007_13843 [Hordeum vulgare]|nr:hypothetical protein D1007_13843 [Hordeum vulgare]